MCGILAHLSSSPDCRLSRELLESAATLMLHRGPDSAGYYQKGRLSLGHRRLSIIDLAAGQQPMALANGSLVLVFNGEIYNFASLREELTARGCAFRTHSDTEVILHAYAEWGVRCLDRFNGMFAFALWDSARELLFVARDRLGIKPLYYQWDGETFACASEIKPLLRVTGRQAELNERVLDSYFTIGYVPAPETLYRGILKLEPGHFLEVRSGQLRDVEYWDFAHTPASILTEAEAVEQAKALFRDAVAKCLVSDVPLGVFLSGGLDSSAVVAAAAALGVSPLETFTVSYGESHAESEESFARTVAERFTTRHHSYTLGAEDFFESIRTLARQCEEPIVEAASIALYRLACHARPNVKVLLSGEGADELFAGYGLYDAMQRIERVQHFLPPAVGRTVSRLGSFFTSNPRHQKHLDWLGQPLTARYRGISTWLTPSLKQQLYHPDFLASRGDYLDTTFARHFDRVRHRDALSQMLYVDTKTWLPDNLLLKADKMTMAASVELRVPFLDHRLVEFGRLPSFLLQNSNTEKANAF